MLERQQDLLTCASGGYKELAAVVIKLAVMSPEERNVCNGFEGLSVTSGESSREGLIRLASKNGRIDSKWV